MTLYANIHQDSKYFAGQRSEEPFEVVLAASSDAYCWLGNRNKYRTSDLDFYVKQNGKYFPSGLIHFGYEMLERALKNHIDYLQDLSESDDLFTMESLYEENASSVTQLIKQVLLLLPTTRPTCPVCGNTYTRCLCED